RRFCALLGFWKIAVERSLPCQVECHGPLSGCVRDSLDRAACEVVAASELREVCCFECGEQSFGVRVERQEGVVELVRKGAGFVVPGDALLERLRRSRGDACGV